MKNVEQNILDYKEDYNPRSRYQTYISPGILIVCGLIWLLFYQAKNYNYDLNIALLLYGFLISITLTCLLIILFFWKRSIIKDNSLSIVVFLMTSSPVALYFVVTNYEFIFGQALSV